MSFPLLDQLNFHHKLADTRGLALAREYYALHLPALFRYRNGEFHATLQNEAQRSHPHAAIGRVLAGPEEPP